MWDLPTPDPTAQGYLELNSSTMLCICSVCLAAPVALDPQNALQRSSWNSLPHLTGANKKARRILRGLWWGGSGRGRHPSSMGSTHQESSTEPSHLRGGQECSLAVSQGIRAVGSVSGGNPRCSLRNLSVTCHPLSEDQLGAQLLLPGLSAAMPGSPAPPVLTLISSVSSPLLITNLFIWLWCQGPGLCSPPPPHP